MKLVKPPKPPKPTPHVKPLHPHIVDALLRIEARQIYQARQMRKLIRSIGTPPTNLKAALDQIRNVTKLAEQETVKIKAALAAQPKEPQP